MPTWTVQDQEKLSFTEHPITDLRVRIVAGAVNVVPTDGPAHLEITEVSGPPLEIRQDGGRLTVSYQDLTWKNLLNWLDHRPAKRHAVVSVAVPRTTHAQIGVVTAEATLSGLSGTVAAHGVSGDLTFAGLSGAVEANNVSGQLVAQDVSGELRCHTVAGDVTVVDGGGNVRANTVSGNMTIDLALAGTDGHTGRTDVRLNTVSGDLVVRLPHPADAKVDATSNSGDLSSAFDELHVQGGFGPKRLNGSLGRGAGRLQANSVSGAIALLKRPAEQERQESGRADASSADTAGDATEEDA